MKEKEIVAGYLYPAIWNKPGDSIWPDHYDDKPGTYTFWTQERYDEAQKEMKEYPADEVLDIKPGLYTMKISYPLSKPHVIEIKINEEGITRQALMDIAAQGYHYVYSFIKKEMKDKPTYNFFGIWGHDIGDLTIHTFYVNDETNQISLGVDS